MSELKALNNKICGYRDCHTESKIRLYFQLGFSALFCKKCAATLLDSNLARRATGESATGESATGESATGEASRNEKNFLISGKDTSLARTRFLFAIQEDRSYDY